MSPLVDTFSQAMRVIDLVGQGHTVTSACQNTGISVKTFQRCVRADEQLMALFEEADQQGMDMLRDLLLNIDNDAQHGRSDPRMASVISKNIMWVLSKRKPEMYGDKIVVENRITADKAIVEALSRGRDRALQRPLIDVTAKEVIDEMIIDTSSIDPELLQFV